MPERFRRLTKGDLFAMATGLQTCRNINVGCAAVGSVDGFTCHRCGHVNPARQPMSQEAEERFLAMLPQTTMQGCCCGCDCAVFPSRGALGPHLSPACKRRRHA